MKLRQDRIGNAFANASALKKPIWEASPNGYPDRNDLSLQAVFQRY